MACCRWLGLLLVLVSCVNPLPQGGCTGVSCDLGKLFGDFWQWRLRDNPEFASNVGDQSYNDKLEDYSLAALDSRKVDIEGFLKRLKAIPRADLQSHDRISYDVMQDTLQGWIDGYKWRYYGPANAISFLEGIQTSYGSKAGAVPFTTEEDFNKFVQRIALFGDRVDQVIERLNKAIELGTTHSNFSMAKVPGQLDGMLKYKNNVTAFTFYAPFRDGLADGKIVSSAKTRDEIKLAAKAAITRFLEKIETLKIFITETYMPATRTSLGVGSLPDGQAYYQACLKWHLSGDLTGPQIHQMGLDEVANIRGEMKNIMDRAKHTGTFEEYFNKLKNDQNNYLAKEAVIPRYIQIYEQRIKPIQKKIFNNIPELGLKFEEMGYDGPIAIYKNGAPDGSRNGTFRINLFSDSNNPTYNMLALLLHETDPGHHLQDAYALNSQSIPMFRRAVDFSKYFSVPLHFPFYTAYSEGWAMYAEDLGEELGIYKTDEERMGKYGFALLRAVRLVVDTAIHDHNATRRWDRDTAIDYMKKNTLLGDASVRNEVDRYATWPGQATSYMVGKLKFVQLREKAKRLMCDHFNMKDFHDVLLSNGAMPLTVLEAAVDDWISSVRTSVTTDDLCSAATHSLLSITMMVSTIFIQILMV